MPSHFRNELRNDGRLRQKIDNQGQVILFKKMPGWKRFRLTLFSQGGLGVCTGKVLTSQHYVICSGEASMHLLEENAPLGFCFILKCVLHSLELKWKVNTLLKVQLRTKKSC